MYEGKDFPIMRDHHEEAKKRTDAAIQKIKLQDEHIKELVRQVLTEEGLIKPSN